ncbi:MAG: hypothetical protein KDE04_27170, partial [Anaerolineales bacterium]|nr:hypothetical protein [Anaerolineales bacterium]
MKTTIKFPWFRADASDIGEEILTADQISICPDPTFRSDLKSKLLAAHPRLTERRNLWRTVTNDPLRIWSMIATLPVIVGIVA